jgi:hypothetical protein
MFFLLFTIPWCGRQYEIMVKEEEIMAEAGGRGYMDMLGLGEEAMADYFLCPSPSSSYLSSAAVSTTTNAGTHAAAASPTCSSYLPPPAGPYQHILSFGGRPEQQYPGGDMFGALQYYYAGGGPAVPAVAVPQKSSPTTECSSSISSMSSSPTATAVSAVSTPKPQAAPKVWLIRKLCHSDSLLMVSLHCRMSIGVF